MKCIHLISHYLFHYKKPKSQNQNRFYQITNKYNFLRYKTNPNMYKSYIHRTNLYGKKL